MFDNSVQNLELKTFEDFEFANNAVEMLRDIALRIPALSESSIRSVFDALASVMPHLEVDGAVFSDSSDGLLIRDLNMFA